MPVADLRLIKAAKRTVRAEITLIIVITLLSSWSIYSLCKLVFSNADSSVLNFHFGPPASSSTNGSDKANQSKLNFITQNSSQATNIDQDTISVHPSGQLLADVNQHAPQRNPTDRELLASYKNEIIKELIARQADPNLLNFNLTSDHPDVALDKINRLRTLTPKNIRHVEDSNPNIYPNNQVHSPPHELHHESEPMSKHADHEDIAPESESDSAHIPKPQQIDTNDASRFFDDEADSNRKEEESVETTTATSNIASDVADTTDVDEISLSTTTESPVLESTTPPPVVTETLDEDRDGQGANTSGQESVGSPESDSDLPMDDESIKRTEDTMRNIDDEVDKMTQPTSDVASQDEQPIDLSGTVQFDDTITETPLHEMKPDILTRSSPRSNNTIDKVTSSVSSYIGRLTGSHTDSRRDGVRSASKKIEQMGPKMIEDHVPPSNHWSAAEHDIYHSRQKRSNLDSSRTNRSTALSLDDDTDDDDDDDKGSPDDHKTGLSPPVPSAMKSSNETTPHNPSARELSAYKKLLDSLRGSTNRPNLPTPKVNQDVSPISKNFSDHQTAGSLYTVDHGLLLYPKETDEHEHFSFSSKKSKSKKDKVKKKVALKKGGHKEKKHENEEKKYHKEKKFKAAKKGKKMKKGEGGKGGKKGSKFYKDKGFKKKGFKNVYVKNEFGQKKSYFDEFRDKDFKKKWKNFDDKYNYAQMKKWQAKDVKEAKKHKAHGKKYKKHGKSKWKKTYQSSDKSEASKKKKKHDDF